MKYFLQSHPAASAALACLVLLSSAKLFASSGVVDAIEKKYVVTSLNTDHSQVTKDGTTMALKTAGIYSLPVGAIPPDTSVVDGKIKPLNMFTRSMLDQMGAHVLQSGEKVYITKIESRDDPKNDVVRFTISSLDSFDAKGQSSQQKFVAAISFKFKKGYLDEAPPDEVEQAIEAIIAPDSGADEAQGNDNQGGQNGGGSQQQARAQRPSQAAPPPQAAPAPPPPAAPPAPAAPPPTITIGESSVQVLQAMGMPLQMIDLGKKKTFVYKNMKIIFVDDKVSDVQ